MYMGNINLQTLKGFRDFLPSQKRKRDFVVQKIKTVFELFGFEPIETPTLEYASLLQGKYGTEADKLMYTFEDRGKRQVGLRYDQTIPTARVLSQYATTLPKYFRRYQIQNVFRAENTQKGRYREFLQCDCDIFGSTSNLADAEILAVFYEAYKSLGFKNFVVNINDRQSLFATLSPFATDNVTVMSIIQTIDKLDKIGDEGMVDELTKKGIYKETSTKILAMIKSQEISPSLSKIKEQASLLGVPESSIRFQPFLARGLDYYTGLIFEGMVPEYSAGSVGGGGRYDNLINQLGGPQIPAVGFAIGFDRTLEVMEEIGLLPNFDATAKALVTVFDEKYVNNSLEAISKLRSQGIPSELYPNIGDKLGKQLQYANNKKVPFVIIIGPEEAKENIVKVKNMKTGDEKTGKIEEITRLMEIGR